MVNNEEKLQNVEIERLYLENKLQELISTVGPIPIASNIIMPYGWRKAAKGRTVWRIIEEVISQNLEKYAKHLGFDSVYSADSEVGVYDFRFCYNNGSEAFVNVKSSVLGGKRNKDDISKAYGLLNFYKSSPEANLYIATFIIDFKEDMTVHIVDCIVYPITWIPDIYINPSNNGNLQSADYKYIKKAVKRTNEDFLKLLNEEFEIARIKRNEKLN